MENGPNLRKQLQALLEGGQAHIAIEQALANFPLDKINTRIPKLSYTPWQLLEHMRIAQWDILEFIRNPNHVSPDWPSGYWPPKEEQADPARWQATRDAFLRDMQDLKELAANQQTDLEAALSHAPDYTYIREIMLAANHNIYHLGELGIMQTLIS